MACVIKDEYKTLSKLRVLFEEFDAAGETLLSLDKVSRFNKRIFLNVTSISIRISSAI